MMTGRAAGIGERHGTLIQMLIFAGGGVLGHMLIVERGREAGPVQGRS